MKISLNIGERYHIIQYSALERVPARFKSAGPILFYPHVISVVGASKILHMGE
jgi:hypothetical protein